MEFKNKILKNELKSKVEIDLDELSQKLNLNIPKDLIKTLNRMDIKTLKDIRANGGLTEIEGSTISFDYPTLLKLNAHANLNILSSDIMVNETLINKGFTNIVSIAKTPIKEFIDRNSNEINPTKACQLHLMALSQYKIISNLLMKIKCDIANGFEIKEQYLKLPGMETVCKCRDCDSAVSPGAYLADLLDYTLRNITNLRELDDLNNKFHQPFGSLPPNCEIMNQNIRQVRICIEILRSFLNLNEETEIQKDYLIKAYKSLLINIGTSYDEIRLARSASDEDRKILANNIGIDISHLNEIYLVPDINTDSESEDLPRLITESKLEEIFGLIDTTKSPLRKILEAKLQTWRLEYLREIWKKLDWPLDPYYRGDSRENEEVVKCPAIDPDLINENDFRNPIESNPLIVLLNDRREFIEETFHEFKSLREDAEERGRDEFEAILLRAFREQRPDLEAIYKDLISGYNSISLTVNDLNLTIDSFIYLMEIKKRYYDGEQISLSEWNEIYNILTYRIKLLAYPNWITEEKEQEIILGSRDFWIALEEPELPLWRAKPEDRQKWQQALRNRSKPPIIDPDIIDYSDLKVPYGNNPVINIWETRNTKLEEILDDLKEKKESKSNKLEAFNEILLYYLGILGEELEELAENINLGNSNEKRLEQLNLTSSSFSFLLRIYRLAKNNTTLLDNEWEEVYSILVQIWKCREFAKWRDIERDNDVLLCPDSFKIPQVQPIEFPPNEMPMVLKWRVPFMAYRNWQDKLQSRIDQEIAVIEALEEAIGSVEEKLLPILRDQLIITSDIEGSNLEEKAKWITDNLLIDAKAGGCQQTTRITQAIETIQNLIWSIRTGQLLDTFPDLKLISEDFEEEWKWIGSYASWRAAIFVFLYPENILLPTLRKVEEQSPAFKQLVKKLSLNRQLKPFEAVETASEYTEYFNDVCRLKLEASCYTRTRLYNNFSEGDLNQMNYKYLYYFFASNSQGISHKNKIYWLVFDPHDETDYAQKFWNSIPALEGYQDVKVIGVVPYNSDQGRFIFLFVKIWDLKGQKLRFLKYNLDEPLIGWDIELNPLDLPEEGNFFTAIVKQQYREDIPPHLLIRIDKQEVDSNEEVILNEDFTHVLLPERPIYSLLLNSEGTDWAELSQNKLNFTKSENDGTLKGIKIVPFIPLAMIEIPSENSNYEYPTRFIVIFEHRKVIDGSVKPCIGFSIHHYDPEHFGWYNETINTEVLTIGKIFLKNDAHFKGAFRWPQSSHIFVSYCYGDNDFISYQCIWSPSNYLTIQDDFIISGVNNFVPIAGIGYSRNDVSYKFPYIQKYGETRGINFGEFSRGEPIIINHNGEEFSIPCRIDLTFSTSLKPYIPDSYYTREFKINPSISQEDNQVRRLLSKDFFDINKNGSLTNFTLIEEAFYFVPMYLAQQLQRKGHHIVALDWYRTIYDYTIPIDRIDDRKIYFGLLEEMNNEFDFERASDWLLDPLNPHAIAKNRAGTYSRFTIMSLILCFLEYADAEFTLDTSESIPRARTLYMTALELLDLPNLKQSLSPCEDIIGTLNIDLDNPRTENDVRSSIEEEANTSVKNKDQLNSFLSELEDDLKNVDPPSIYEKIETERGKVQPPPSIREIIDESKHFANEIFIKLLTYKSIASMLEKVAYNSGLNFLNRLSSITGFSIQKLENKNLIMPLNGEKILKDNILDKSLIEKENSTKAKKAPKNENSNMQNNPINIENVSLDVTIKQNTYKALPGISLPFYKFCILKNPILKSLRLRAELNLYKIRTCRNITGMKRKVEPFAASTDTESGLPVIGAGGQIILPGLLTIKPTLYKYRMLIEKAKQIVQIASQIESNMLFILERRDYEYYNILKARQELKFTYANLSLQSMRIREAEGGIKLATLQQERAQIYIDTLQEWIDAGLNEYENKMIGEIKNVRSNKISAVVYDTASREAHAMATALSADMSPASWKAASLAIALAGIGATMNSFAINAEAEAQIAGIQSNYERAKQQWELQKKISQQDVLISTQQIKIAEDHLRVVGEEYNISEIQVDHAKESMNFLNNKFTNVELYDWMASVLEGVYSYFLQQATSIAKLAENQLAFERQEIPPAIIKSDYWDVPAEGMIMAGSDGNIPDRHGLTGSARLMQDIYELDLYATETNKRKLQLSKTFSLAKDWPIEFQKFRETGLMNFRTVMSKFDRDFPGHFLRIIRRVKASVIALIPPTQGVKATLTKSGISRVVIGGDIFQEVQINNQPESISFTSPYNATGIFELNPEPQMLFPFEGSGVDTIWELCMPKAANLFDYRTIFDILITIDYTALDSFDYRKQVILELGRTISGNRPFSFRHEFADQWYDLNNPEQTNTPMVVNFKTRREDFPPNIENLKIEHIILYFARKDGVEIEIPVNYLHFTEAGNINHAPSGGSETINGKISTRLANGMNWMAILDKSPFGDWELALPTTIDGIITSDLFKDGSIEEILFIIDFKGLTPEWPE